MQKEYADTLKFSVVLSFAQDVEPAAIDFLKKSARGVPVYNQLNPPGSPCGRGIPDAYLFDHTGKLVKHGHPSKLYDLVAKLVEATPDPVPPGILDGFEPVLLEEEARALEDPQRPAAKMLAALEELTAGDDDRALEARELLAQVRAWLPAEVERLERISRRRPGTTAFLADQFLTRFAGVDDTLEMRVESLEKTLSKQPDVDRFVRAIPSVVRRHGDKGMVERNKPVPGIAHEGEREEFAPLLHLGHLWTAL